MGWLLCFLLVLIALIGSQFPPAERDAGHAANKTRSTTWSAPSTHVNGDPAGQNERTGAQTPNQ
jgi:hypothetical protein